MSAPSTSGLSVELLLRVIDVKYGYFTLFRGRKASVEMLSFHGSVYVFSCPEVDKARSVIVYLCKCLC